MDLTQDQWNEFVEMFGEKIPDPDHNPMTFGYYVRLFKYLKSTENDSTA
jgi:hypothetical protein